MFFDIFEFFEVINKIFDFWKFMLIELVSVDVLVSMDEVMKYYCEEFWLMESIFVICINYVGIIVVLLFGMKLGILIVYCRFYYS